MLTLRTKLALAILHDIQYRDYQLSTSFHYPSSETVCLLQELSKGHLITLMENQPCDRPESYLLAREYHKINILSILEALGEGVYFNRPSDEDFYSCYGTTARKLGIVNQMTRLYLMEISIAELPVTECPMGNTAACL
ncbi:hypothetical protein [Bacteroides oleiciplenus]|uniref:Uncharacterized protein n=1 Tax=Bacteroides oleiciplenus TaxID=626931 RepID=A0A3E5BAG9_9BACE|nr:hypothetical protein [Bacteroides oleiciplenus]RGN34600.1 hypothetical protein DXB65_12815 [Bacteroides oleiciplenus]